jgi:peptidyl-prolyl cis-trans isomerase C
MFARYCLWIGVIGLVIGLASTQRSAAQPPPAAPPPATPPASKDPEPPPPPAANVVAATVNGQTIPEIAVYRGLLRENPLKWAAVRKEVLNYLIDNMLVDQYLTQLKINVDAKEVEDKVAQIKVEAKKENMEFAKLLQRLFLTEDELRRELTGALRWDKFVIQQGTDKVLREMFDKNKNMFDGSQMQAKHILIAATADTAPQAQLKIAALRKQIENEVAAEMAKLAPTTDNLTREKERMKFLDKAFAAVALKESSCPSKEKGGDLGWFPRTGLMVEPFARAAFALKPYQMSEAVPTEFGYHLILAVDSRPGQDVKFEDVKPFVQEVYGERLREAIITNYKPRSRIEMPPAK